MIYKNASYAIQAEDTIAELESCSERERESTGKACFNAVVANVQLALAGLLAPEQSKFRQKMSAGNLTMFELNSI